MLRARHQEHLKEDEIPRRFSAKDQCHFLSTGTAPWKGLRSFRASETRRPRGDRGGSHARAAASPRGPTSPSLHPACPRCPTVCAAGRTFPQQPRVSGKTEGGNAFQERTELTASAELPEAQEEPGSLMTGKEEPLPRESIAESAVPGWLPGVPAVLMQAYPRKEKRSEQPRALRRPRTRGGSAAGWLLRGLVSQGAHLEEKPDGQQRGLGISAAPLARGRGLEGVPEH